MKRFDIDSFSSLAESLRRPYHAAYLAMYSSVYGGMVTDPVLMMVPADDHMVHRGDAVFETFKCVNGSLYNFDAHIARLLHSAAVLEYKVPCSVAELGEIVRETVRAGGRRDACVRLLLSRGPGGFGVNPYECPQVQLYVIVTTLAGPFMDTHPNGARVKSSAVPVKPAFFARVKNCNYLPNVLMKKEAIDAGVDFVVAFDDRGFLGEGATENMGIVTPLRELLFPRLDSILCGTTMMRVIELAAALVEDGRLSAVRFEDIPREAVVTASEILIVGTTPNVTAVTDFDGFRPSDGRLGPVYEALSSLLLDDIRNNTRLLTPVF